MLLKFKVSLKQTPVGGEVGRLENSGRLFPCVICKEVTGWRNNGDGSCPGVPVCSDECLDVMDDDFKEVGSTSTESNSITRSELDLEGVSPASQVESQTDERESDDEEEAAA